MAQRETFASRRTAIMAMAGSAIGLGNIWRFPYMAGEYGGAAFIIIYLLSTLFLSLPILLSESIIGRRAHAGTFGAMEKLQPGTKWKWLGLLTVVSPLIILSYYSVVGGWSADYFLKSLTLTFSSGSEDKIGAMFGSFIADPWMPLICHTVFLALTSLIVLAGVKKGIEKFSRLTMPLLFVLIVIIIAYSLSMPGSGAGIDYLLKPDFSKLTPSAVASAMGQSFFSLSLGVGTILTYSSYISKEENIFATGLGAASFDLLFALMAGFAVMPAVFAAGIAPGAGPGLVFETLPYIFAKMGATSPILSNTVAILFFLTILVAALTSSISMLEVGVAFFVEEKKFSRRKAVAVIFLGCWLLGSVCSLSFGPLKDLSIFGSTVFEACDKLTSNFLMTFGGLLFTIFAGWKMSKQEVRDEFTGGGTQKFNCTCFDVVYFLMKYIAPVVIVIIFITNLVL